MPQIINGAGQRVLDADGKRILRAAGAGCGCCAGNEGEPCWECEGSTPLDITVTLADILPCGCNYNGSSYYRFFFTDDPNGTYTLRQDYQDACTWYNRYDGVEGSGLPGFGVIEIVVKYYATEANCNADTNSTSTSTGRIQTIEFQGGNGVMLVTVLFGGSAYHLFHAALSSGCPTGVGEISNSTTCGATPPGFAGTAGYSGTITVT